MKGAVKVSSSTSPDRRVDNSVWLDFHPGFKGLVRLAGWLWSACAAIFAVYKGEVVFGPDGTRAVVPID